MMPRARDGCTKTPEPSPSVQNLRTVICCMDPLNHRSNSLLLLTGPRGAGKTTWCLQLMAQAQARGLDMAGLISPARLAGDQKVGIEVLDVRTGERRLLARARAAADSAPGLATTGWVFDEAVMAWGTTVLEAATPCELLFVDELGPLEWEQGRGWTAGLAAVDSRAYTRAVVVVRPSLLSLALARWPHARVVESGHIFPRRQV